MTHAHRWRVVEANQRSKPAPCLPGLAHRWRIEEAHGPTSTGVCLNCDGVAEHKNWLEDTVTPTEHRSPWGATHFIERPRRTL